ncbi:hypothetical protein [Brevundimonas sp.]|jgi:hypothetical protein
MKVRASTLIVCGSVRQTTRACDFGDLTELIPPYFYIAPTSLRARS